MDQPAWLRQPERSNRIALGIIRWIALHAGRSFSRLLLYPIVSYFYLTAPAARRASRLFQKRITGREPSAADTWRHLFWFAAALLDRVYFLRGDLRLFRIDIHGAELLHAAGKRGAILVGAHLGSFDALRALGLRRPDLRLKILMFRSHNALITRLLESLDPRLPEVVIDLDGPRVLQQIETALRDGELVCMLGDRAGPDVRQIPCTFLGSTAWFPTGPARLARLFEVPLIAFSCIYLGGNRYRITFERIDGCGDRARTCSFASWLERQVQQAPLNWFNFYDFWDHRTQGHRTSGG